MGITLTVLVARNPDLGVEEFHEAWREHGRMIAAEPAFRRYIRSYAQHHRTAADYHSPLLPGAAADGVAIQRYDSFDDLLALLATPEYAAKMQPDEARLLDLERCVVLITDDPEDFI
jgi:hypothetical protein